MSAEPARPWWQTATFYEVYVRSFQDTDGDGVGDLEGVAARLDYLVRLGVDAVWLSPVYPSPFLDGGYDVTEFCDVDPVFGDLAAFDRLVAAIHGRGLKIIIDFVVNHTSDRHPWFQASRASRDDPKRNWYVWRDGKDGGPPNNWGTMLEGSAWTRDAATDQFYYHAFLPEQPDLNWRNPAVRDEMADVLRFWLRRGVDGVRVDGLWHLVEDELLRDDLPAEVEIDDVPVMRGMRHAFTADRPETHSCLAGLRRMLDTFPERVLIGEVHLPVAQSMRYYAAGAHMPFNFTLVLTPWNTRALAAAIDHYVNLLPADAWPNWQLGNHDVTRIASRIGHAAARVAAMLLFTLGGTVFIYAGDELGLEDVTVPDPDLRRMPEARHGNHAASTAPHRAPMPWDGGPRGGFTTGLPWLPIGPANLVRNAAEQAEDEASLLTLYRDLIELRRREPVLVSAPFQPEPTQGEVLIYRRSTDGASMLVTLNIAARPQEVVLSGQGTLLRSTHHGRVGEPCRDRVTLQANEGVIIALGQDPEVATCD